MKIKKVIFNFSFLAIVFQCNTLFAQQRVERKIIIQEGKYYFIEIDENSQLATLFFGKTSEKLDDASNQKMPIGRTATEPQNPLAFDLKGNEMIGINWILNSNNSRYEAIKAISLKNWEKPRPDWKKEDWAQVSFDQPMIAPNEPWENMLEANNILSNTFFDLTLSDELIMGICNQDKFWLYSYDGTSWQNELSADVKFTQYFSLINQKDKVAIVDAVGNLYAINKDKKSLLLQKKSTDELVKLLIVNKDENKYYMLSVQSLEAGKRKPLKQIIKESATEIIF